MADLWAYLIKIWGEKSLNIKRFKNNFSYKWGNKAVVYAWWKIGTTIGKTLFNPFTVNDKYLSCSADIYSCLFAIASISKVVLESQRNDNYLFTTTF